MSVCYKSRTQKPSLPCGPCATASYPVEQLDRCYGVKIIDPWNELYVVHSTADEGRLMAQHVRIRNRDFTVELARPVQPSGSIQSDAGPGRGRG